MYLFLGSPALQLDGTNRHDVHVFELLEKVIPCYDEIEGRNWADLEAQLIRDVVASLWLLGEVDFNYASGEINPRRVPYEPGASSYLLSGEFMLGNMLKKETPHVDCFDLAALVYTAFKAFGRRRVDPNGPETDVSTFNAHVPRPDTDPVVDLRHSSDHGAKMGQYPSRRAL